MANMSDFFENKFLDWFFRAQAIGITGATAGAGSGPANFYFGLFTTTPTDVGGGTEVTGGSYARQGVAAGLTTFKSTQNDNNASTGTNGTTSNTNAITFSPAPTANWGTINGIGVFDAISGGNLLIWAPLTTPKTVNSGDPAPSFSAGAFTYQCDN